MGVLEVTHLIEHTPENTYYSNLDKVRNFTPVGFTSLKKNEKVAHLKGTDPNKQIGPSITVKVNSGDKVSLTAQSFYPDNSGSQRTGLAETALSQLVNVMINPAGLNANGKAIATERLKAQGFEGDAGYRGMMNKLPNSDYANENDRPKAFMVWMLFDSEMKLVKTGKSSGARQIPEGAGKVKQMAENEIVMDQGGFLTAYTVNESPASVYIDNFQMSTASGPVQEINNYYPFGMINEGITTPGISDPLNNYKYNGKELQKELNLEWLDYGARFYDPQIGRWNSEDPLANHPKQIGSSPFSAFNNNPIRYVDPTGMIWKDPKDAERLNKSVNNKIKSIGNDNTKIQAKIDKGGLSDKKLGRLQNRLVDNNSKVGLLNNSISDIKAIGEAKETYALAGAGQSDGTHRVVKDSKGIIQIEGSNTGIHLHEIRHVGQSIEAGGLRFNSDGQLLNSATTIVGGYANEVEAYKVGYSYDGQYPVSAGSLKDINQKSLMDIKFEDGKSVYNRQKN